MIHQGVIARGKSIHDILAITIKLELKQEYNLNLGEMYSIIDYISELETETATVAATAVQLRTELKNFLAAFDAYFDYRGTSGGEAAKIHDAKQAMFSAANQARKVLE